MSCGSSCAAIWRRKSWRSTRASRAAALAERSQGLERDCTSWRLSDADAPQLHKCRSKHRQLLHRRMLQHRPLQHKKRLLYRLAYRIWPIPTMSKTLTSIAIVLSSHPPDLRAHDFFFEPARLLDGWQSSFLKRTPVKFGGRVVSAGRGAWNERRGATWSLAVSGFVQKFLWTCRNKREPDAENVTSERPIAPLPQIDAMVGVVACASGGEMARKASR